MPVSALQNQNPDKENEPEPANGNGLVDRCPRCAGSGEEPQKGYEGTACADCDGAGKPSRPTGDLPTVAPNLPISFAGPWPILKVCAVCRAPKALDEFHKHKTGVEGRDSRCKACKRLAREERYRRDPEGAAAAATAWKKKNRIRARVQRLKNYAARRGATGDKGDLTADEWEEILESYRETFPNGSRGRYRCAYCARRTARVNLQIDHVVALSRGGRNTRTNVVPACGSCNAGKCDRDRWPILPSPHLDEKGIAVRAFVAAADEACDSLDPDGPVDLSFP